MKKLILFMALVSATGYSKTQFRYVPKENKNFFSLMLGYGPVGVYSYQDECCSTHVSKEYGPVFGAQYVRMFNKTFGGNLGFMSNNTGFAGITIGW